jgi:glycosyltransferase involved in cell wall biosynthesis
MRIGVATHNYPPHPGGLETIVHQLTLGFAKRHEVIVASTAWQGKTGVTNEDGATVHRLPAWHGAETRGVPYATPFGPGVGQAVAALRSCDVLHAHGSLYPTTLLALLARRRTTPLFVTEHVGFVPYSSSTLNSVQRIAWATIGSPVAHRCAKVIAYNSRVRDWLAGRFGEEQVAFIRNGVDTVMFRPRTMGEQRAARSRLGLPAEAVLGLFVGRAAEKKNLEAVLDFPARHYQLVVCGAHRTLPPGVLDLGVVPHAIMPDVLGAADFLLHPAIGEGFPVIVQEAMASGLPVALLWDSGYAGSVDRESVIAAETLQELAAAADRLAVSSTLRQTWSATSRTFAVTNWNWDTTVERHLELFRHAASGAAT